MGWVSRWGSLWVALPSVSAPHFASIFPFLLGPAQLHLSPSGTMKRTNGEGSPIHYGFRHPIQVRVSDSKAGHKRSPQRPAAAAHSERPPQRWSRLRPARWASATAQASQEALRGAALRPRPPSPQVPRSARFRYRGVPRAGPKWRQRRGSQLLCPTCSL